MKMDYKGKLGWPFEYDLSDVWLFLFAVGFGFPMLIMVIVGLMNCGGE